MWGNWPFGTPPVASGLGGMEKYRARLGQSNGRVTVDVSDGNVVLVLLSANTTFEFRCPIGAGVALSFTLLLLQDATGSRTVTWPSSVDWGTTGAPTLTTTANKVDVVTFLSVNGGKTWYAFLSAKGFAAP
jgi:hypothetical protein